MELLSLQALPTSRGLTRRSPRVADAQYVFGNTACARNNGAPLPGIIQGQVCSTSWIADVRLIRQQGGEECDRCAERSGGTIDSRAARRSLSLFVPTSFSSHIRACLVTVMSQKIGNVRAQHSSFASLVPRLTRCSPDCVGVCPGLAPCRRVG